MDFQFLTNQIPEETLFVLLAYALIAGLYLVVVPLALYAWMNFRWHSMSKLERLVIYGFVFLFFPGMIVFAPFINFRLSGQGEV
ncbi:NAD(P)H-quinone oxidoreductase subunit L [Synechococcus sp. M16CYN]|uniref:NAD(P)H-quinone oxidoreductase subunit L n=1 Tax=Synechococcus sp. M16CYN TaxID=3103139 RepID=UPI003254E75E